MPFRKIIGAHSCREALKARAPKELKKIYLKPGWRENPVLSDLALLAETKGLKPEIISLKKLNHIGEGHQGLCVLASAAPRFKAGALGENATVLIVDRAQDPRNLGAIIRSAWLMSAEGIFISSRQSAGLSPSVIKTASGGAEHVPVEIKDSLRHCLEELKKHNFWIYALDPQAKSSLWEEKFEGRTAFVLGGEGAGLRQSLKKASDKSLSIPQTGKSGNYNLSVSASLALGESFRQKLRAR